MIIIHVPSHRLCTRVYITSYSHRHLAFFFLAHMYKMVSAPGTPASFVLLWTSIYSSFCLEYSLLYRRSPMVCSFTSFRPLLNCQVLYEAFPVHPLKNLTCLSPTSYPPSLLHFSPEHLIPLPFTTRT